MIVRYIVTTLLDDELQKNIYSGDFAVADKDFIAEIFLLFILR